MPGGIVKSTAIICLAVMMSCGTSNSLKRYPFRYLAQEVWVLSSLNGIADLESTFSGELPYLTFGTDGITNGFTGCNNLVGAVTTLDDGFSLARGAYTKRSCPGEGEQLYIQAMQSATDYHLQKGRFALKDGNREVLVFIPKE